MINEKLRRARTNCGFTQEDMATVLGIDRSTYTYYETGKLDLTVRSLLAVSSVFNIAFDWFITPDEDLKKPRLEKASTTLNCSNIFLPQTLEEEIGVDNENLSHETESSRLTNDERVFLARYRILAQSNRKREVDEYLDALVQEELGNL